MTDSDEEASVSLADEVVLVVSTNPSFWRHRLRSVLTTGLDRTAENKVPSSVIWSFS